VTLGVAMDSTTDIQVRGRHSGLTSVTLPPLLQQQPLADMVAKYQVYLKREFIKCARNVGHPKHATHGRNPSVQSDSGISTSSENSDTRFTSNKFSGDLEDI
jgi:hypothetical protein